MARNGKVKKKPGVKKAAGAPSTAVPAPTVIEVANAMGGGGSNAKGAKTAGPKRGDGPAVAAAAAPSHCSPARFVSADETLLATGSCLTAEEVLTTAQVVGVVTAADVATASSAASALLGFDPAALVLRLHEKLGTKPGEEDRWASNRAVSSRPGLRQRLLSAFRPTHPKAWLKEPRFWLSNLDIDAVMRQYQEVGATRSPGFRFVGVFPRDFASPLDGSSCVSEAVCRLHVADELRAGVRQLGFVINLDKHTGRGTHWTSCYVGLDPGRPGRFGLWYYDSVGRAPPAEVRAFSKRIQAEVAAALPASAADFVVSHNRVRKQFMESECGVYAMFFLVACVQTDVSFEDLCSRVMRRDNDMHALRRVFFRAP